jgi:hypothetical protein
MSKSNHFAGSVFRTAMLDPSNESSIWESFYLSLGEDRGPAERLMRHLHRNAKRWWLVDIFDFSRAPKKEPALLYVREIVTDTPESEFVEGYFSAPYTLKADFDPYARNPTGFDPARRGSVANRARELAMTRLDAAPDDPWFDVTQSYEHYGARTLVATDSGYLEGVWFLSSGVAGDPAGDLKVALETYARRIGAKVLATVGPYPANEIAKPATGLRLTRAFRNYPGGVIDFEARIVDLTAWKT